MFSIVMEGKDKSFTCEAGDSLLRAGLRSGLGLPYECNTGGCGTCKFQLIEGETEDLWPDAPGITARDRQKGRKLACQNRPKGNCRIKMGIDPDCVPHILPKQRKARLDESRPLTHDMWEFRFKTEDAANFLPGQYALFQLPGVIGLRAYSMANLTNETGEWHFHIKNMPSGAGSRALFEGGVVPGQEVEMDGPYGLAYLRDSGRDIVCIAGGSGLSPMISIARGAAMGSRLKNRRLHFFYGGREPRDICGEEILRDLPGFAERMSFHAAISEPSVSLDNWSGHCGFIHELAVETLTGEMKNYEFYFAGPPAMAEAVNRCLMREHKVPFAQLHFDRFF